MKVLQLAHYPATQLAKCMLMLITIGNSSQGKMVITIVIVGQSTNSLTLDAITM